MVDEVQVNEVMVGEVVMVVGVVVVVIMDNAILKRDCGECENMGHG